MLALLLDREVIYSLFFVIAIVLNKRNERNLLITLLVGLSFYMPTELITNYYAWYAVCFSAELSKIVICSLLYSRLSPPLIAMNMNMFGCHAISFLFKTNIPYYTEVMPYLELFEVLICILFANKTLHYIKGKIRCKLK
jgi:hypothetical protein